MPAHYLVSRPAFLLLATAMLCGPVHGQGETYKMLALSATGNCQALMGPDGKDNLTIGVTTVITQTGEPLRVTSIAAGGPASNAGIQKGDLLWGSDSGNSPVLINACELLHAELSASEDLTLFHQSPGQTERTKVIVHPKPRSEVYPYEARLTWRLMAEFVDGGRFRVLASMAQGSQGDFTLKLGIDNYSEGSLLQLDESKIFVLSDQGAEFAHQPYAEWKHQMETLVARANALAQGMESVPYTPPPPPPPPTHYQISSIADGSYVLTPMGGGAYQVNGQALVESTVSPEYTPSEQMAQAGRAIASTFDAIRIARTNKEIAKLRQRAAANAATGKQMLEEGIASHLETTTPIAPGAARVGILAFVQPKNFSPSTVKAIVVVRDSSTTKDYFVTFEFHQ
jgi:hypothetical protein